MPKSPAYPESHQPAMQVPKGGSSCAKCRYYSPDGGDHGTCGNSFYQEFYGTGEIPYPADEYCSDWFEPKKESTRTARYRLRLTQG